MTKACALVLVLILFTLINSARGQEKNDSSKNILETRIAKDIINSFKSNPEDTLFTAKAEDAFMPYEGKIIRNIKINQIGFERSFYSDDNKTKKMFIKLGNALHSKTKERTIKENLFIRKNKPLNPYKLADNERYLRDLQFILDAKIDVIPVGNDSVDLVIITRDVFSLGGEFIPESSTEYTFTVFDANLFGYGQRLEFNGVIDHDRYPNFGKEIVYRKNSIGGSLINGSIGYTEINSGSSYGLENEAAFYVLLNRPLVSPYTRFAGGLEYSLNNSTNVYKKPDSIFLDYKYHVYDLWTGYNIGVNDKSRNRHFIALRWFHQDFDKTPKQIPIETDPLYNNNSFILSEFTFFRQNFYKSRFIYGFGRTEDIPYGHTASLTVGYSRQLELHRVYWGGSLGKRIVNKNGSYYDVALRGASFIHQGNWEDATVLLSLGWFSQLFNKGNYKLRQYLQASYTKQINPHINEPLNIGNEFGVNDFRTDSLRGHERIGITSETVIYTKWKFLGFHFAPLIFYDVALLPSFDKHLFDEKPYFGLGAGMRARNENLVVGTIEFKFTYYPRVTENISPLNFSLSSNLRVKFSGSFVRAPSFIRFN